MMDKCTLTRLLLVALMPIVFAACAPGARSVDLGDLRSGADDGTALCDLRIESAYDETIEAGVRAGAQEVSLGSLEPDEDIDIVVPCSYGAVTVFRLVPRDDLGGRTRLGLRSQALNPDRRTIVTMRPEVSRGHLRPGR
ncbi:MAG: hypothetical protein HKN72_13560 [Gemmatimonadetes bacterium]|nr:hypothetical protein [Gemmatimonadota bacterium]NNL30542.1 hypothetical protein [Gemmatimonadota bacterium]